MVTVTVMMVVCSDCLLDITCCPVLSHINWTKPHSEPGRLMKITVRNSFTHEEMDTFSSSGVGTTVQDTWISSSLHQVRFKASEVVSSRCHRDCSSTKQKSFWCEKLSRLEVLLELLLLASLPEALPGAADLIKVPCFPNQGIPVTLYGWGAK